MYNNSICLLYRYVVSEFAYFARAKFMSGYNLFCLKNSVSLSIICYFKNIMLTYKCISHPYICEQNNLYSVHQPTLRQLCSTNSSLYSRPNMTLQMLSLCCEDREQISSPNYNILQCSNTGTSVDQSDYSAGEAHQWSNNCAISGPIRLLC